MAAKKAQTAAGNIAVIYARYSSSAQNDASIEQQIAECTEYARQNNLRIVNTFEDRAKSGRSDSRPGFQRMIRSAERHEFQVLLAYKSNRIARNMLNALAYEDRLAKAGVRVVYCKENFGDNAAGRLALRMMMSVNEFYSDNMAEDIRRGMYDSASQGKVVGTIPYGYRKDENGKYAIDESAAAIVREIFRRVGNDEAYADIAADLNARGILTKQKKPWGKNSFHSILANERYTGVYIYGDLRIEGGMPAIIGRELFLTVQKKLGVLKKVRGRHRDNGDYLLTGKLFCGHCLAAMVGCSGTGRLGGLHYYYACQTKRTKKKCDKKNVRKEWIEEEVTRAAITTVLTDTMIEWIADKTMEMVKAQKEASQLHYYEERLAETKKSIANLVRAIEMGIITTSTKERLQELEEEESFVSDQIAIEKLGLAQIEREQVVYWLQYLRRGDAKDKRFQKEVIDDFIRAVYLYDDHFKLVIDFTGKETVFDFSLNGVESGETNEDSESVSGSLNPSTGVPVEGQANTRNTITVVGHVFVLTYYFE